MGAGDQHGGAVLERQRELLGALEQLLAVGELAVQDRAQEVAGGRFRGALGCAHALDLGGDDRQQQAAHGGAGLGLGAHVERAHHRVRHAQGGAAHALATRQQRALLGGRAGGHRQRGAPRVGDRQAGLERPGRRAHHLGQPRPGLDRLGDRVERREI